MIKFPILLDGYDVEPAPEGTLLDRDQVIDFLQSVLEDAKSNPNVVIAYLQDFVDFLTGE